MPVKRYICDYPMCGKEFRDDRGLGIHKASHGREKIECPKCGRRVSYIDSHMRKAHTLDPERVLGDLGEILEELVRLRVENADLRHENIELRKLKKHS